MEYIEIEAHILNKMKEDINVVHQTDIKPLISFFYKVYMKLTQPGFLQVHSLIVKNEIESFVTEKEDYSLLSQYSLQEKNYIKALFVLYVSQAELAVY